MLILLSVFLFITVAGCLIVDRIFSTNTRNNLDNAYQTFAESNESIPSKDIIPSKGIIAFIFGVEQDGGTIKVNFDSLIDKTTFSIEQATNIVTKACQFKSKSGNFGKIYYKFYDESGRNILVAIDMTDSVNMRLSLLGRIALVACTIYLILFLIVLFISDKIFQPIKENLEKQKQFISDASHELKTPITIISANTDVLKDIDDNQWLDNIKTQTKRLETIVSDMLSLAKAQEVQQDAVLDNFNISQEIIDAVLPFDALAFENQKVIISDITPNVQYYGNKQDIVKITNILIDNAVKYTTNGGKIFVSLVKDSGKIILTVKNDGSNVPNQDANKIFERFYRAESSRSRNTGGSGLGLAIAKNICDNNKWKIFAISELNVSMQITVVI